MNGREGVMLRQVCDPPSSQEEGTSSDAREQKRQSIRQREWRQVNKVGNPCPHRCGFLPTNRPNLWCGTQYPRKGVSEGEDVVTEKVESSKCWACGATLSRDVNDDPYCAAISCRAYGWVVGTPMWWATSEGRPALSTHERACPKVRGA